MGTSNLRHRYKYCIVEKGPNPLDTEEGEDTDSPTITEADDSYAGEDGHLVDPRGALEKLLDVTHNGVMRRGWIVNGQPQEVWVHRRMLRSVSKDLSLALEAVPTSAGSFCRPNEWCALLFVTLIQYITTVPIYSIAHSLPDGAGTSTSQDPKCWYWPLMETPT